MWWLSIRSAGTARARGRHVESTRQHSTVNPPRARRRCPTGPDSSPTRQEERCTQTCTSKQRECLQRSLPKPRPPHRYCQSVRHPFSTSDGRIIPTFPFAWRHRRRQIQLLLPHQHWRPRDSVPSGGLENAFAAKLRARLQALFFSFRDVALGSSRGRGPRRQLVPVIPAPGGVVARAELSRKLTSAGATEADARAACDALDACCVTLADELRALERRPKPPTAVTLRRGSAEADASPNNKKARKRKRENAAQSLTAPALLTATTCSCRCAPWL